MHACRGRPQCFGYLQHCFTSTLLLFLVGTCGALPGITRYTGTRIFRQPCESAAGFRYRNSPATRPISHRADRGLIDQIDQSPGMRVWKRLDFHMASEIFLCKNEMSLCKKGRAPGGDRSVADQRPRVRASAAAARLLVHQSNPALARAYAFRPRSFSRPAPSRLHASLHPAADQAEQCCCWHQCPRPSVAQPGTV